MNEDQSVLPSWLVCPDSEWYWWRPPHSHVTPRQLSPINGVLWKLEHWTGPARKMINYRQNLIEVRMQLIKLTMRDKEERLLPPGVLLTEHSWWHSAYLHSIIRTNLSQSSQFLVAIPAICQSVSNLFSFGLCLKQLSSQLENIVSIKTLRLVLLSQSTIFCDFIVWKNPSASLDCLTVWTDCLWLDVDITVSRVQKCQSSIDKTSHHSTLKTEAQQNTNLIKCTVSFGLTR